MDCPACGAPVPEGAKFCSACGREARPSRDERRVVTVLFGDLVGFTSLSERLDPEQVKNLVDQCFEQLAADVVAFGGQVDKVVGDAIVALFGAPVAHEDDAERAVRAALRMQATMGDLAEVHGSRLQMRIGVNTGEVLVGAMRAAGTTTAMGDVVNTASRLQTAARPGEVLVGPATHAATQAVIAYESRGSIAAKGRDEPVPAWLAGEALLPPGYRPRRIDVPMVGREHELGQLHHAVESAVVRERALFALLVGDPGLGKTRLAEEVGDWAGITHGARVLEGRCVPYGEANVWWPIAEALRRSCDVDSAAPEDDARRATAARVAAVYERPTHDPEVQRTVNGLLTIMGYETTKGADPGSVREEVVRSLVAFIDQSSRHQPVVLQLSDLHWADDLVLDLLGELFERLHHRPAVVLATARPSLLQRWTPPPGRHNALMMHVDPLDRTASRELLGTLLGGDPSAEVTEALIDRSGGNPFFLEELVQLIEGRTAVHQGGDSRHVGPVSELPDTLRGLVAARLDGLSPEVCGVLQDAAVIGRSGTVQSLIEMAEKLRPHVDVASVVTELVDQEILVVECDEWSFRSDLVREVAYGLITKSDRARRHAGIARHIEEFVRPDDPHVASLVDRLSHHYGVAVELVDELGLSGQFPADLKERARRWITESARQARDEQVLATAVRLYSQALSLAGTEPSAERTSLLLGRAEAHEEAWELVAARADAELARDESDRSGYEVGVARALVLLGEVLQKEGDSPAATASLRDAAQRFATLGEAEGQGEALRQIGMVDLFRGQMAAAEESVTAAFDAFTSAGSVGGQA
ncbi:MAG TPA: adenylate/guanylate cyclase domain-containing protein, partial [Acidimicrobiales bacterium]